MYFLRTIVWVYCVVLGTINVGRCFMMPDEEMTSYNIAKGVLQNDKYWQNIIDIEVTVVPDGMDQRVAEMLTELDFKDNKKLRAQPILQYLVTDRSPTRMQLLFGMEVLASAISCQFINTIGIHISFINMYALRKKVEIKSIREYLSLVQVTLTKYMDKLATFGKSIELLLQLNNKMNMLFDQHKKSKRVVKKVYMDAMKNLIKFVKLIQTKQCAGVTDENKIVNTINVVNYNNLIFTKKHTQVEEFQLMTMIENIDQYDFIDFSSLGIDFWKKRLDVVQFIREVKNEWI